ncbi:hypothetical protein ACOSQ2_017787 [Xanthoceras sorbifolium]
MCHLIYIVCNAALLIRYPAITTNANLRSLRRLSVSLIRTSFGSLHPLSHCPLLQNLYLEGKMMELPKDINEILPNLEIMRLWGSELKHDPMPLLGKLPNLIILELVGKFYCGKKLVCYSKSFPCLEILEFYNYLDNEIEEWEVEERALPRLRGLRLPDDVKFTIPERVRSIPPPGQWQFSRGWPDTPVQLCLSAVKDKSSLSSVPARSPAAVSACSSAYILVASGDPSTDSRSASKATMSCNHVKQRSTIPLCLPIQ